MSREGCSADVFAIPDFWRSPKRLKSFAPPTDDDEIGFFHLDINAENYKQPAGLPVPDDCIFKLPSSLGHLVAPPITPQPESSSDVEEETDCSFEDPWLPLGDRSDAPPQLQTWEDFYACENARPELFQRPLFVSEAGPVVFDQLLTNGIIPSRLSSEKQHRPLEPGHLIQCLVSMALGRGSSLFSWESRGRSFRPKLDHIVARGYSVESVHGVVSLCKKCGNSTRILRSFVEKAYCSHPSPCRVALANSIDKLLCAVQSRLGSRCHDVTSLLRLQAYVEPLNTTTSYLERLVSRLSRSTSDEQLLSLLFEAAQAAEFEGDFLRITLRDVMRAVSVPWVEFAEEWLGLRSETGVPISKQGLGKGFAKVEKRMTAEDADYELEGAEYVLDSKRMPSFVPKDLARCLFEAGKNLRFLREYHGDHPLSHPQTVHVSKPPRLEWQFDWDGIRGAESEARDYEQRLAGILDRAILSTGGKHPETSSHEDECVRGPASTPKLNCFEVTGTLLEEQLSMSMAQLDNPTTKPSLMDGSTAVALETLFSGGPTSGIEPLGGLGPHWSLVPRLSFAPMIQAQARVVNKECVRLLFDSHQLHDHLEAQLNFHLLGDRSFCSRLSNALFDPELDTAERKKGVALRGGTMGLRLMGRDTWPPASSELRLALIGVLGESWQSPSGTGTGTGTSTGSGSGRDLPPAAYDVPALPGDMSFAVRELSSQEMEKCMDPNSLEALDFLRLSYKAPAPLAPIITPAALGRYDRIFRLLLRVLRMLFVVNQLFRRQRRNGGSRPPDSPLEQRFRIEASHFVSGIATYFLNTGVAVPWRRFGVFLDGVRASVGAAGPGRAGDAGNYSPEQVRRRHDELLDEIMHTLLLRKRQEPVLRLLEEIFALILRLARLSGPESRGRDGLDDAGVKPLYGEFRRKLEVFTTVCRGLGENAGHGKSSENTIDRLLLALDMNGFYSSRSWRETAVYL